MVGGCVVVVVRRVVVVRGGRVVVVVGRVVVVVVGSVGPVVVAPAAWLNGAGLKRNALPGSSVTDEVAPTQ